MALEKPKNLPIIENPILNSPYKEPNRHFRFSEDGITNEIVEQRRISSYFVPIAKPKKRKLQDQLSLSTEWTEDRIQENKFINKIRERVGLWRKGGYVGATKTTIRLLEYWTDPGREKKLFFCQIEALETAIYIAEVAKKDNPWIDNDLRRFSEEANPLVFRVALKMATGTGKTVVMAMLIAWQTLNKIANTQDARFSDTFLIVTPGITIRDRLRVLLPNDPQNYYRVMNILPNEQITELGKAKMIITNFHAFQLRETVKTSRLTKAIITKSKTSPFTETPAQMVRRVCRELGNKKNIVVINDEAHHCYRRKQEEDTSLKGAEKKEAQKRNEEARVWISGLEAVKARLGVKAVYDLSATPFFLKGSGYPEGTLYPWVVSDFSLIDAIEAGIVKVPRVPVADDKMTGILPTYRDLWTHIREHLPKKGRGNKDYSGGEPKLPAELQGALHSLYGNYGKYYQAWEKNGGCENGSTPPVFIVVCNNTSVSKLVFDYIAGWEKALPDGSAVLAPGALPIFSNVTDGYWSARPNTILIDSEQLESGEAMSTAFKKLAVREIEEFKQEYRERFPSRDADGLTDEDLLREVMNTVGKPGKLGENVKCVVSVSMLTEGWDANTVTHILGVRAFGTQLLCEQVIGRGLRRISYVTNEKGMFEPEYAEVYGVPFSFIPCAGTSQQPEPGAQPTRVRALEDRIDHKISFPRVNGYRYEIPAGPLEARFTKDSQLTLSTADIPTKTENAPIVGESSIHNLDDLKNRRFQEVIFLLAKLTIEKYFRADGQKKEDRDDSHKWDSEVQAFRFPEILNITKRWLDECLICKDNTFPQLLLLLEFAHDAADRVYQAIVATEGEQKVLKPILKVYDTVGSTDYVDFDTIRPVFATRADKCHISHVVCDTESWEQKMAQVLEEMDEVITYVKNHNLGFTIPYTIGGEEKPYIPDFIALVKDESEEPLNLILEVSGQARKDKAAKTATTRNLWVPAINNQGTFGRWAFLEISDPWDAKNTIRSAFSSGELLQLQEV